MARAALLPCRKAGCAELLTTSGYCAAHSKTDTSRPNSGARGYDHRWRIARARYLTKHPLCVTCQSKGRVVQATVVDHIIRHQGDKSLFWDKENNWQALCTTCHNRKTAHEVGFIRGKAND